MVNQDDQDDEEHQQLLLSWEKPALNLRTNICNHHINKPLYFLINHLLMTPCTTYTVDLT